MEAGGDVGLDFGRPRLHPLRRAGRAPGPDRSRQALPRQVVEQRYGDPEIDAGAVSYNAEFSPAEGITFYSFANASKRDMLSNGYFRAADDNRNRPEIYPDGFLPEINNVSEDRSFVGGVKGYTANGWNVDLSYN